MTGPILHDYWRSGAAYRTRIALHLKGLPFRQLSVNLRAGAQRTPAYRDLSAQGLVPVLEVDGQRFSQSGAILEWLEEVHPEPPLLPATPNARAVVRAMAAIVGSDIHPLNNLRVLQQLRGPLGASEAQIDAWTSRWICEGFAALDSMIGDHGGLFAYGDRPTLVDCYLTPQVYSAERFKIDLAPFPAVLRVTAHAAGLPAFQAAHPQAQPDAPAV
jgi:maleylpyruvate isomerase